jgi:hypothetical protein
VIVLGLTQGYLVIVIALTLWALAYVGNAWADAWKVRGRALAEMQQAQIKAEVDKLKYEAKIAEAQAKLVTGWTPPTKTPED